MSGRENTKGQPKFYSESHPQYEQQTKQLQDQIEEAKQRERDQMIDAYHNI